MKRLTTLSLAAAGLVLAGCGGEAPDQDPPVVAFYEGGASSPFFASDGSGSPKACAGGLSGSYASFRGGAANTQARAGGAAVKLKVSFSDPSGIKRAYLQIPGGKLASPTTSKTVQVPTASGDIAEAYEYNFFGDADAPEKTHTVIVDLTHSDSNRIFNAFAIDMNDNRSATATILIGEESKICG